MHGRHDVPWHVCADRDEAEIEGAAVFADVGEGGAVWEVGVCRRVVVVAVGFGGDGAVAGVAGEVDG